MGDPEGRARRGDASGQRDRGSGHGVNRAQVQTMAGEVPDPAFGGPMQAVFRDLMDAAPVAAFVKDARGRYVYVNPYLLATLGRHAGPDWHGKTDAAIWPASAASMIHARDKAARAGGGAQIFSHVLQLGDGPHTVLLMEFPLPMGDSLLGVGGIAIDLTSHLMAEASRDKLAVAVEQAAESVMLVDLAGQITYVNPAFERVTGYSSDEVLGKNPRLLQSGLQTAWFYDAMWASISRGLPWVADIINRRKDGSLFTEEAVISPIVDSSGAVTSYMAIKRDVTHERELAERSSRLAGERALIGDTIRSLRMGDKPEATAQSICRRVASLSGVTAAAMAVFELSGRASTIGFAIDGVRQDPELRRVTYQRSQYLREQAARGPWIEPWVDRPSHSYNQLLNSLGIRTVVYAPIRDHERVVGVLMAHSRALPDSVAVPEILPAIAEFAELTGVLLGHELVERAHLGRSHDRISNIILDGAFKPVFQPIVDLKRNAIVGYEALTRFDDGASPERVFAGAAEVGLGAELEIATLRAALAAAEGLPRSAWLNLNASPEIILAGEPLRTFVRECRRRVVIEVTEHTAIADYPTFRSAMTSLGRKVQLAVDDAGAGFASLRHILELHAAFVKLDRWLIAGLESDDARQAMIVGLRHFAAATGCRLIAEGIETEGELAVLRELEIELGQGYLLGRPLPAEEAGRPARLRPTRRRPAKRLLLQEPAEP